MQAAIEVEQLNKTFRLHHSRTGFRGALRDLFDRQYKTIEAVKNITFCIPAGEICGYIGENGAGKSTTIKMLTGILVPTSGKVQVNGYVPYVQRKVFSRHIGVVFGQRSQLWWDIGVIESFQLLRKVYGVGAVDYKQRLDELVARLDLADILHRPVRKLSLGQRMRCELAAAMIHNPAILFLDEPTIGLDILVKMEIRSFLLSLNARYGTTILLTTHDLQDIEALCSRVIMLDDGQILYDGGLAQLKNTLGQGKEIRLQLNTACTTAQFTQLLDTLEVDGVWDHACAVRIRLPKGGNVSAVIAHVAGALDVRDLQLVEPTTDEIVRDIYQRGAVHQGEVSR